MCIRDRYNLAGPLSYPAPNLGIYERTGRTADVGKFKAPTLRNIALTAPYMHDGSIPTLELSLIHISSGSGLLRELPPKIGDFIAGWRPIRVARVTVEHQRAGFQRLFEFLLSERNCLVVVVRTDNIELQSVAH